MGGDTPPDEPANITLTPQPNPEPTTSAVIPAEEPTQTAEYILNTNTHKFHYPDCSSVNSMNESNKEYFSGARDEIIARSYEPCKRCEPGMSDIAISGRLSHNALA